jgi:two-component system sensor histidine kinase TctE
VAERSIRRLLLGWLLVPLAAVLVTSEVASYGAALTIADEAYDRALLNPALALAQRLSAVEGPVQLDLPAAAGEVLRVDATDRVYFAVRARGRLLGGQGELTPPPALPAEDAPVFYDGTVGVEPVRIAAITVPFAEGPVLIQVAETLVKRDRLVRRLLLTNAVPELLFLGAALAVVWLGVKRGLAPLDELRTELAARSHRDLRPVAEARAPAEVRPLVQELNRLLGRLAESMEVQQRFVADAAHQLRTPLAALQAQVEAARREGLPPELTPTVERLSAATRRAAHLARQLLTLAAIAPSAGRPFAPEPADLADVAHAGVDDWLARADAKRVDLGFELEAAPVAGEPQLLGELAANLVENALNYTPAGGEVTVRTGRREGWSFLEVEDSGPGIPESERGLVFERFHRVRGTAGEGTGLGLAIVREIADRHGASVDIRAPDARGGTVVAVSFAAIGTA